MYLAPFLKNAQNWNVKILQGTMFPLYDNGYFMADLESHYLATWDAMEELFDIGLTKSIGLSNFNRSRETTVRPTLKI